MTSPSENNFPRPLRVLVAPDSFKGSLSASMVAARIAAGIQQAIPSCAVTQLPIADGGEGSTEVIAQGLGGVWHQVRVLDANGNGREIRFAECYSSALGKFAVFDVAEVVGLPDAVAPPGSRTTRGVGQAIRAIYELGFKTIALGLGGSSTNDAGAGMLAELALCCLDEANAEVNPMFDNLQRIRTVQWKPEYANLRNLRLIGLTDVNSPLIGAEGASKIFGAQKGFNDLDHADTVLTHFSGLCCNLVEHDLSATAGTGAAGGLGFAVRLLGGSLRPGADFVLAAHLLLPDTIDYDWIITGEGRSDAQTLLGKGPAMIARLARGQGIPVTLLSGAVDYSTELEAAFDGCFSIQPGPVSLEYAIRHAGDLLQQSSRQAASLFIKAKMRTGGDHNDQH